MADAIFTDPIFHDEEAAREHLELIRWPNGPVCPHCGATARTTNIWRIEAKIKEPRKGARPGVLCCGDCRKQFTVTVGTVFEHSKVPLHKWVLATHLLCSSKKGMSSHQLHRTLGVTYKTAWFMTHRIREAMKSEHTYQLGDMGPVEVDETYTGTKPGTVKRRGYGHKNAVLSLVERDGEVRSFHIPSATSKILRTYLEDNITPEAHLITDDAKQYKKIGQEFAQHDVVNHTQKEYVRGDAHTNNAESFFSIFKRGLMGTYHHVGAQHLQRYVTEFDFRYNHRSRLGVDDEMRSKAALKGISGKRLTYRRTH
jgi:transposase-like protein